MPFARCKFYTENGDPVRAGCHRKGAGCGFVHPGEPGWATAPPSFRAKDKGGDTTWSDRSRRNPTAPSPWEGGGDTSTSAPDKGDGWDTGGGSGWGSDGRRSGWDTGESVSANQTLESTQSRGASTTKSLSANLTASASSTGGWGGGRGGTQSDGWGASGWGNDKDAGKSAESGTGNTGEGGWGSSGWGNAESAWGNTGNDGWGSGWGNSKEADKGTASARGNAQGDGWGSSWGNGDNATTSRRDSYPLAMDNQIEKAPEQGKGKGRAVIAPPRIRIPDNDNKKIKRTGTNNEPLGPSKWGESHAPTLTTAPTPTFMAALTPVTATPTELTRTKRKRDAAPDDKFDGFKEYVKAWERAVRARYLLVEAEAKRDRWFRTQKSACYARIGAAGRDRLDDQRTECEKEVSAQREKLSGAITSLMDLHEKISSNFDLRQRYNVGEEAEKFISESKAFVDEARALLVAHVLKDKEEAHNITQKPDITLVDSLRSQVRNLEERFEQAQSELTLSRQRDVRPEINEVFTSKIQDLRMARQHEMDGVALMPHPGIAIPPSALGDMERTAQQVSEIEAKVPHTVEDIRVLLFRVDAMTKRVSQLEEEVSVNKETYRKVEDMAAQKEEAERRVDQQLQDIRGQFDQLVASQPPAPVVQPVVSSTQDLLISNLQPIFEAMLDKFYEEEVQPTIKLLQQIVVTESDRHQAEAIQVLWGRMKPAMNMVAGVSEWLDSQLLKRTAPVEGDISAADQ